MLKRLLAKIPTKINRAKINEKATTIALNTLTGMDAGSKVGAGVGGFVGLCFGSLSAMKGAALGGMGGGALGGIVAGGTTTYIEFPKVTSLVAAGLFAYKYLTPDSSQPTPTNEEPASPKISS